LQLLDLIKRACPPEPWAEGDNIPWYEPGFSARMLREHLTQAHDAASRRAMIIDRHVEWIHQALLGAHPSHILDLGCGPGLYSNRLARLGHQCVGIDYSPASIAYAQAEAESEGLACRYELADLREADLGTNNDLAMLIFGELNVFPADRATDLLTRIGGALRLGGTLLLEIHTFAAVRELGAGSTSWRTADAGLFSDEPYLCLTEHFWHSEASAATTRHYVIDTASGGVTRYAQSFQAYTEEEYSALLRRCGFTTMTVFRSLTGSSDHEQPGMLVIVARR
jgi:SAM-dependent methyltransferase